MSRTVTLVKATIRMTGRWAVGKVPLAGSEVDLPVLADPRAATAVGARPFVPGGSLAGSLRRHLGQTAEQVLGPEPPEWEQSRDGDRVASPLAIRGTVVLEGLEIADRGSTRINGRSGAADRGSLRTEQYVTLGRLVVAMDLDSAAPPGLAESLAGWRPILGRSRSTGLGDGLVERVDVLELDLDDATHLTWWLTERHSWYAADAPAPAPVHTVHGPGDAQARVDEWRVPLVVVEPVRVGTDENDLQTDGHRALGLLRQDGRVLVPGSSWKGIFHHRAETILRLVAGPDRAAEVGQVVDRLFGSASGRGTLAFGDSLAAKGAPEITRTHVAIDRFTGGVIDGGLYRVMALDGGATLELRIRGAGDQTTPVRNLLRHVLRDLHDGLVSVGGMGTRGYGRVAVTDAAQLDGLAQVDLDELTHALVPAKGADDDRA